MRYKDLLRNPCALFSKHDIIIRSKGHIRINVLCLGRCHPDPGSRMQALKLFKVHITGHIQMLPVIHTGTFDFLLCQTEAKRLDQMQVCSCGNTGSAYISRICRDLRLM